MSEKPKQEEECTCGKPGPYICQLCDGAACKVEQLTPRTPSVSFCCECLDHGAI